MSTISQVTETEESGQPVLLGPSQTARLNTEKTFTCILCQETQKLTIGGPVLVLAGFVQQATVLCQNRYDVVEQTPDEPLFLNSHLGPAPHTSTCGHVMHATCWQKYFNNVMHKEHRRPYRLRHPTSFDIDKQEFLCPLCECLSNTVLPLVPPLCSLQPSRRKNLIPFEDWLECVRQTMGKKLEICTNAVTCTDSCTNKSCNYTGKSEESGDTIR